MSEIHNHYHFYCSHKSCHKAAKQYVEKRSFSATENHVLEIIATMPDKSAMMIDSLIWLCAESMPKPEEGQRDNRVARAMTAIESLSKGENAPLRLAHGVVHFLVTKPDLP